MSTPETIAKNPLEDESGLSLEDNQKAKELRSQHLDASLRRLEPADVIPRNLDANFAQRFSNNLARETVRPVNGIINAHRAIGQKVAEAKVKKHYSDHEVDYQAQAVKDAAAKGVHTDFGTHSH